MRNLEIARTVQAPRSRLWAVLADYPNIAEWNDGVINSRAIGDATEGVGAQRHVELDKSVAMRETVTEWIPEEKMVVAIDQIEKMPVAKATMTFTLSDGGDTTPMTMSYDYEPKGGPFGFVVAAMLGRPMRKGFNGFVDDLQRAAQASSAA
ncbi:MAG: SRPBCC family protein [Acidimicrobiales bacterium]